MNLLFVTDVSPYPPDQGSSVIAWNWMQSLASRHQLSLLSIDMPLDPSAATKITGLGIRLLEYISSKPKRRAHVRNLGKRQPSSFALVDITHITGAIIVDAHLAKADAVILIGPSLAALLPLQGISIPSMFVPFDSISLNLSTQSRVLQNPFRRTYAVLSSRRWAWAEANIYPHANATILVTQRDANIVSKQWDTKAKSRVHVIPNGVDSSHFAPTNEPTRPTHLVFTGNMNTAQSAYSITWFLKKVLPKVRHEIPGVTFNIVGRNPSDRLTRAAQSIPCVRVTGFVPDIRASIASASIYVAPIKIGSGIKNRVLEASAMGKAIVATPESVHGLHPDVQSAISIATEPTSFADAIISLIRDPKRQSTTGDAARRAVERHHNWHDVGVMVEEVLAQI